MTLIQEKITLRDFITFIIFPAILYAGFATDFSFNFFEPYWLWHGYNEFYLSLIDGRLDVPAFAIGREGQFIGDKAYMYYGILPTISRFFMSPFVDLRQVPISAFSVWLFSVTGTAILQLAILSKYKENYTQTHNNKHALLTLILISIIIWFCSGTFIILQEGNIYHEPYAASLCLANIYIALLIKDNFFTQKVCSTIPYAILSGLCIHARMPLALAMYVTTLVLIYINLSREVSLQGTLLTRLKTLSLYILKHWATFLILFIFGMSILIINYLRFGDILAFMGINGHYGYYLEGEGYSLRSCKLVPNSDFATILRIIPNTVVYSIGGWNLHDKLMNLFQTGYGRKELPLIPITLLWCAPFVIAFITLFTLLKDKSQNRNMLLLAAAFSIGGVFQLTYVTIAHRYIAELWPVFLILIAIFVYLYFIKYKKFSSFSKNTLLIATILTFSYNMYIAFFSDYHYRSKLKNMNDYQYSKTINEKLSNLNKEKIEALKQAYRNGRKEGCAALEKSINATSIN